MKLISLAIALLCFFSSGRAIALDSFPGTQPYTEEGDLAERTLDGIHAFFLGETERSIERRAQRWNRDLSSEEAYTHSIQLNRERFCRIIGIADSRVEKPVMRYQASVGSPALLAESESYSVYAVYWPVLPGVDGEGLLLQPKSPAIARVVALPDADQTPEMLVGLTPGVEPQSQFARRLAEQGCQVIVPVLLDRRDEWSGNPALPRFTNQPHREWIYRQAFQMGRHIIGYEVQKVLAAVDWFEKEHRNESLVDGGLSVGVAGYGEGGLIAFYSAAVDERIDAALVSGYFDSRQNLWREPLYRNVFGLLDEFGDAEIASLIVPRNLVIEYSEPPTVEGPPEPRSGRHGAAPGRIDAPDYRRVVDEFDRACDLVGPSLASSLRLVADDDETFAPFGSSEALTVFMETLRGDAELAPMKAPPQPRVDAISIDERQRRQVKQLEDYTQSLLIPAEVERAQFFWIPLEERMRETDPERRLEEWEAATQPYKEYFWDEVIGRLPPATLPMNARTQLVYDEPTWTGYVVVLDVWPEVISWGYLLIPKDMHEGERRPVVVCQHGISGTPEITLDPDSTAYIGYAAKLAEQGFVVYSPYNPNAARGHDRFLLLQRLANPLKKSIFSVILGQHDRILDFLCELPFVDPQRIGFYGLSYGGKTAMRATSLLDRYAVSICSADFNEWIRKTITVHAVTDAAAPSNRFSSYMFTNEYEIYEFNLGNRFNYAEMAALIAPRPFMVERGHFDSVASDEWVAFEYAKVRRLYNALLRIPERATIEFFDGGHVIGANETFEFLRRHLDWPHP